jgi:hypothetical protein
MDNFSKQKALYQLNRFINTPLRYQLEINAIDISILYTVCRYLDMPLNKCEMGFKRLAKESGNSYSTIKRHMPRLQKLNVLLVFYSKKIPTIELGEIFDKYLCSSERAT